MKDKSAKLHVQHIEQLLEISRELTSTMALEEILDLITKAAVDLTNAGDAGLLLLGEDKDYLKFATATSQAELVKTFSIPIASSLAGHVFTTGEPVVVEDVNKDPRFFFKAKEDSNSEAHSFLAVPLQYKHKRIGVLEVGNKKEDELFNQEDVDMLTALAAQATVAIENARLTNNLEDIVQKRTGELETAVSQLKQEIEKHKQTTDALIIADERWRTLVTHAPARIVTMDREGILLFVNRGSSVRTKDMIVGTSVYDYLPPKAAEQTRQVLSAIFQTGIPQKYETFVPRGENEEIWYENDVAPLYQDGEVTAAIFIATNVTQRKKSNALLFEQQKQLAILHERERIAQNLHDGLGQVMGYINLQLHTALDLLEQQRKNQTKTILKKLSNITQNSQADIRATILDIRNQTEIGRNFLQSLKTFIEDFNNEYNIQVKTSFPDNLPTNPFAPIVEDQVLRLIQEALTNVQKHAHVDEARLMLLLSEDRVQIIVEDEGVGFNFASQKQEVRTDTHFGLVIMHERVEELGGELQIRTAPNQGTKIIIQIPRWPESNLESLRALRILLADDHPLFVEGLLDRLITKGIPVIGVAQDGIEAQELALTLRPDMILMDIHMPNCDGVEATRQIKAVLPDVKIAMLTVAGDNETLFSALKYGADGYLLKEMNGDSFLEQLSALARGEIVIATEVANKMMAEFIKLKEQTNTVKGQTDSLNPQEKRNLDLLTPRQAEILNFVAQGMTYKEVGKKLHLTEAAIKYHMGQILNKLHLKKRNEAILLARRNETLNEK